MNWDHVTAPFSKRVLTATGAVSFTDLCRASKEMHDAFMEDAENPDVTANALRVRENALEKLDDVLSTDPEVEIDGEVQNVGIDKDAAVSAIQAYWSDGEVGNGSIYSHVESYIVRGMLEGSIAPTAELASLAHDYAYLQHEAAERNDVDDFEVDRWETMCNALDSINSSMSPDEVISHLRIYYKHWERFSSM